MGTCTAWYFSALSAAVWPGHKRGALRWRHWFIFLVLIIPAGSTALQMGFVVKYKSYVQIGYDNTFCDVTEPLWPKLLGYGALPLIHVTPCVFFNIFAITRLRRTMRAHKLLWRDMANQVRFEPAPTPPIHSPKQSRPGISSGAASFRSSYGLLPGDRSRTPSGLRFQDIPAYELHETTQESIVPPTLLVDRLGEGKERNTTLHPEMQFPPFVETKAEHVFTAEAATIEGDVSSYGGAPASTVGRDNLVPTISLA
ncbi:hypothetical protein HWV62_12172 [Athelia sp. TMB]|nr:hypothetical protein HWV62_12172 [Athelia sp. TMB]